MLREPVNDAFPGCTRRILFAERYLLAILIYNLKLQIEIAR